MTASLAPPVLGTLVLTRVLAHFIVLTGLLAYQFIFRDYVNPFLSVPLYLICSCVFLTDGIYLSLDSRYHQNKALLALLFFLDSLFVSGLILFLGVVGLYPALFISLFLFFAFRLYGNWWGLSGFVLWTSCVIFMALMWQGGITDSDRVSLAVLINFILLVNFLGSGWIGGLVKDFHDRITALRERSFFDPDQVDRPPTRLEPALNLSRKIKPVLSSLLRGFSTEFGESSDRKTQQGAGGSDKKQLKQWEKQIRQFQKFVDDFIEFAEPEKMILKALDFNRLIEKILKEMSSHPERPKALKEKVELRSSGWIRGSASHLEGALKHILLNAFQALKIQIRPLMTVIDYDEKGWLVLEISDNGQGMEEEDIRQAFEPLFSKRLGIRGMGLALAFKVVKSHGGSISLNSTFQKGAQVKIQLPLTSVNYSRRARLSA